MTFRVVCISLTTAAGGEPIGKLVADELGFRYVDDEVITLAAERAGLDRAVVEDAEHHKSLVARLIDALIAPPAQIESYLNLRDEHAYYADDVSPPMAPPAEHLRRLIQGAILEIASRGGAVIVAHAASMALARHADVLRVHVTAPVPTRVRRLWVTNKLRSEEEHAMAIAESDRERQRYLARFYDIEDELPTHYDLVINTEVLRIEQAVAAVVAVAKT